MLSSTNFINIDTKSVVDSTRPRPQLENYSQWTTDASNYTRLLHAENIERVLQNYFSVTYL